MSDTTVHGETREETLLRLRRHGRVLVLPVLVMLALAAAAGYFVGALPEAWMNWAAGLGALALFLLLGLGPVLGWLSNRTIITDRRVIVRQGFFVHRRSEVPLSRVREVRSRRGPVQRLFGSGDIELMVAADAPARLRDVPGPQAVVEALQQLVEQAYQRASAPWPPAAVAAPGSNPFGYGETTVLPSGR